MNFLRELSSKVITLDINNKVKIYKNNTFNFIIFNENYFHTPKEYSRVWCVSSDVVVFQSKETLIDSIKYYLITTNYTICFMYDETIKDIIFDNDVKILTSSGIIRIVKNMFGDYLMIELRGAYDLRDDQSISLLMRRFKYRHIPFEISF